MNREKIRVNLIGEDGNIFNLLGIAARALRRAGYKDESMEMQEKVYASSSYDEALCIIMDYVDVY